MNDWEDALIDKVLPESEFPVTLRVCICTLSAWEAVAGGYLGLAGQLVNPHCELQV